MGVGNDRVDDGESLVIDFDLAALPYGVENLTLTMNQFGGGEAVDITVYDIDGITVLGSFTHPASSGSAIDLSTFNGIGSVQIENNSGGNSTLRFADYDPAPAPASSITPAGEDNGSNLTWVYGYETDLDGNGVYQATITDSNDGSQFIMRSNGFYSFTPDQTGAPTDVSMDTTSQANIDADPNLNVSIRAGGSTLQYSADGIGVVGGNGQLLSSGEALLFTFSGVGAPNGVENLILSIRDFQSGNNDEATVVVTHDTDGDGILTNDTVILSGTGSGTATLDLSQFSGVTQFDIEYTGSGYDLGLSNISYQIPAVSPPTNLDPVLVDYVLTDTDGQSDTARLALYTIDQTVTGSSGVDSISGGSLNDAIIGDAGDDILFGNDGNDSLSGGADNDTLSGGAGNDYLSGGDGQDSLSGGIGNDTLDGGAGDDLVDGSSGDDVVLGGDGNDQVYGGSGGDRLEGGAGDDLLTGGAGNDVLFGDAGEDRLIGVSGNDSLTGGDGIDIFALESGDEGTIGTPAVDTIADFTLGVGGDVLDLSDMLQGEDLASLDDFLNFSYDGLSGDTTISIDVDGSSGTFESAQEIVLSGVDLSANGTLNDQQILDNLLNNGNLIVDQ
jgi:Ca2+-binding RTX toxin-like protein